MRGTGAYGDPESSFQDTYLQVKHGEEKIGGGLRREREGMRVSSLGSSKSLILLLGTQALIFLSIFSVCVLYLNTSYYYLVLDLP
jgi:hypothetical protein